MAVSDDALITCALLVFNYLILWRGDNWMKKVIGDFFFILIGIATYIYFSTDVPWGIIIAIMGLIDLVFRITKA